MAPYPQGGGTQPPQVAQVAARPRRNRPFAARAGVIHLCWCDYARGAEQRAHERAKRRRRHRRLSRSSRSSSDHVETRPGLLVERRTPVSAAQPAETAVIVPLCDVCPRASGRNGHERAQWSRAGAIMSTGLQCDGCSRPFVATAPGGPGADATSGRTRPRSRMWMRMRMRMRRTCECGVTSPGFDTRTIARCSTSTTQ